MINFWKAPIESLRSLVRKKVPQLRQIRHFHSEILEREVDLDIYLPPDYKANGTERYPLLLINDGQDLHRADFSIILSKLYKARQLKPIIAVGIYASDDRIREYGTASQPDYKNRGDRANIYSEYIVQELLPFLYHRFRPSGLVKETAFAGFSLGGLSAMDIAWAHPQIFGAVGVFSGALWWRNASVDQRNPDANRIMHAIIRNSTNPELNRKFFFQCGTHDEQEDRNNNGIIDAIDDTLDLIRELKGKGVKNSHIEYLEIEGGTHDPETWGVAFPDFLKWVY